MSNPVEGRNIVQDQLAPRLVKLQKAESALTADFDQHKEFSSSLQMAAVAVQGPVELNF